MNALIRSSDIDTRQLEFEFDWIDPLGAQGDELRATWARLQIRYGDDIITQVHDYTSRGVRDSIFVPLYPLAEWFATNWWFLLSEVQTPDRSGSSNYASRHYLRYAREGFALPDLAIKPFGNLTRLEWFGRRDPQKRVDYLAEGIANINTSDLRNTLSSFVASVSKRLEESDIFDTLLQEEWKAVTNADKEEEAFCETTASLGLDPYSVSSSQAESIIKVNSMFPQDVSAEFFSAARPEKLVEEAEEVVQFLQSSENDSSEWMKLKRIRKEIPTPNTSRELPWVFGYQYARELRKYLKLNGEPIPSFGKMLDIPANDLDSAMKERDSNLPTVDALVALNKNESPVFAFMRHQRNRLGVTSRFAFCRALFEYLAGEGTDLNLVTKAKTARQKANRAFAAEFLVPAASLAKLIPSQEVDPETIDGLANHFGVSSYVILHQMANHKLAKTDFLPHHSFEW